VFNDWLDRELNKRNWTRAELARRGDISQSALSLIYSGQRKPGIELCGKVAKALGLPAENVLRQAGLLDDATARDKVMEILAYRASLLDARQLDELLKYADFIRERDKRE
jgi:transcriptional regulator with XRE-family HTH domain